MKISFFDAFECSILELNFIKVDVNDSKNITVIYHPCLKIRLFHQLYQHAHIVTDNRHSNK